MAGICSQASAKLYCEKMPETLVKIHYWPNACQKRSLLYCLLYLAFGDRINPSSIQQANRFDLMDFPFRVHNIVFDL